MGRRWEWGLRLWLILGFIERAGVLLGRKYLYTLGLGCGIMDMGLPKSDITAKQDALLLKF
jgi:hypothetical protein